MNRAADSAEGQARVAAFTHSLHQLGWTDGRNVRIDIRWGEDKIDLERKYAAELIALGPEIVFASGTLSVIALQGTSRTLPIVFVGVTDPVGASLVDSLARPGGNATGFMIYEYSFGGKRLELLKQIAPGVTRVAVLRDPSNPAGGAEFAAIQALAQSLKLDVSPVDTRRDAGEIERAITTFARTANGGLIVTPNASVSVHRDLIVALAARHRLPAVYPFRYHADGGGLVSYGPDVVDQCRRAAGYVDRILKGEKAADLPVQAPTKYEMVINLKTAKALGLTLPESLIARADEVIE
ncbi:MAG: ABC transporter substrate-binding protein [Bradyrhizobium sp.]|uniref:ABC transporter substrate-binding protein n=1 Tax=Bradyrhizobium sp. TaxID=376 RepID=UPI003C7A8E0B